MVVRDNDPVKEEIRINSDRAALPPWREAPVRSRYGEAGWAAPAGRRPTRQAPGGTPTAGLNARENAASHSYPTPSATSNRKQRDQGDRLTSSAAYQTAVAGHAIFVPLVQPTIQSAAVSEA